MVRRTTSVAIAALTAFVLLMSGCYYTQAARGQLEIMRKREPVAELIGSNNTPAELARRLQLVEDARDFSIRELGLPDNESYRTYANIDRDYVVWNVFAAPEFSLEPKTWCFPVAGCVAYRGYFSQDAALKKANKLRGRGFDVAVGGVPAYSTLGRFPDPILSTMMHWEDADLVATMFHELAHQVLYVKGDSGFNESFATVVAEVGIERWLTSRGRLDELEAHVRRRDLRRHTLQVVLDARNELECLYMTRLAPDEMRRRKADRLAKLASDIARISTDSQQEGAIDVERDFNNASLATVELYHGRVAEFRALLSDCDQDLECFYREARRLARTSTN